MWPLDSLLLLIHEGRHFLSRFQFVQVSRKCLVLLGQPSREYSSHTFRIGATTWGARWAPELVKRMGDGSQCIIRCMFTLICYKVSVCVKWFPSVLCWVWERGLFNRFGLCVALLFFRSQTMPCLDSRLFKWHMALEQMHRQAGFCHQGSTVQGVGSSWTAMEQAAHWNSVSHRVGQGTWWGSHTRWRKFFGGEGFQGIKARNKIWFDSLLCFQELGQFGPILLSVLKVLKVDQISLSGE